MAAPEIVPTAKLRPGKCVLSGETQGPLIDTKRDLPRYGRVYVSLRWFDNILRDAGYIKGEEVEQLRAQLKDYHEEVESLRSVEADFNSLLETITDYLPQPEAEIVEREVSVPRAPTDEEIETWIAERGGAHEAVQKAKIPDKGSTEEWFRIYGNPRDPKPAREEVTSESKTEEVKPDDGPDKIVELYEQQVDLDKVLAENIDTIQEFLEGKPEYFIEAIVRREWHLAEHLGRKVRKGVLEPLGYWDSEDGALYPDDSENRAEEDTIELGEDE